MKNQYIYDILSKIQSSLETGKFIPIETEIVELKGLSTGGDWKSLKETVCAFLNTNGGYIIAGIHERNMRYILNGFNRDNESNLIDLRSKIFQVDNGTFPDLSDYLSFDYEDFQNTNLVVVLVRPVPEDLKYLKFDGIYYERILSQDKKIPDTKILQHQEYKQELEYAKEIIPITEASLNDLSLDKINHYITLLNREIRKETLKADLQQSMSFLARQYFMRQEQITTLGMLICGDDPFHFLENRVAVDCYLDTGESIAKDKKIFRNDVISLMEDTFKFVWGNIKIGRSVSEGGSTEPEYPEDLIREVINNALAHRDYYSNNFIAVTIKPNEYLEIKNPGSFKQKLTVSHPTHEMQVRRIIPGIPETKNPKLASALKVFEKIESRGRGMATLVNACLTNKIDLPYYDLSNADTICLRIPSGKLIDEQIESWLNSFQKYIHEKLGDNLTIHHKSVLAYFYKSEVLNRKRLYTILLTESNNHFNVIESLKKAGLIFEHPSSTENAPLYMVDRELMKDDFSSELKAIFESEYMYLDSLSKKILNIIYRYTYYNKEPVSARQITPEIYQTEIGSKIDIKNFENIGRKVRRVCNKLYNRTILVKLTTKGYKVNFDFKKPNGLL
jgi:predicted HTH transcriptional regulator